MRAICCLSIFFGFLLVGCGGGGGGGGSEALTSPPPANVERVEVTLHLDEAAVVQVNGVPISDVAIQDPQVAFVFGDVATTPSEADISAALVLTDDLGNRASQTIRVSVSP